MPPGLRMLADAACHDLRADTFFIPGPRSGTRNPDPLRVLDMAASAVLDSGLACGDPE
jgi:hypothetical protein